MAVHASLPLYFLIAIHSVIVCKSQEINIIGKNSMLYDPISGIPYPCDAKKQSTLRKRRADGDSEPIKLQPCPFPNATQEHRWMKARPSRRNSVLTKMLKLPTRKRNDVIRKISKAEEKVRGQLYGGVDVSTGGGIGLSSAGLGVINILSYTQAFDTKTGMPYVCDPNKKKPDNKIDHRWNMIVPPCPDFKKCLFPWKDAKDCETKIDGYPPTKQR